MDWLKRLLNIPSADDRLGRQIQPEPHTRLGRYPELFARCAELAKTKGWGQLTDFRILSFGCSTGEECVSLASHFPGASILGVDVNKESLEKARRTCTNKQIRIEPSSTKALRKHGPFHMIWCMSVLCHWPQSKTLDDLSEVFPFARFEETIQLLHDALQIGGLLVIYNSNYCFSDSRFYSCYRPVDSSGLNGSGFVHKFSPNGKKMAGFNYPDAIFEKVADQ